MSTLQRSPESVRANALLPFKDAKGLLVEGFERDYLLQLLRRCGGNISRAARESGMHRKSIERLVKKYQLNPRHMKPGPRPSRNLIPSEATPTGRGGAVSIDDGGRPLSGGA